jgi:hypothetical protein
MPNRMGYRVASKSEKRRQSRLGILPFRDFDAALGWGRGGFTPPFGDPALRDRRYSIKLTHYYGWRRRC